MKLYKTDKVVLSIKNDPAKFLNGLTANTLDKPQNAFLNVHGKIVATFEQIKAGEDQFLVLIEPPFVEDALTHLEIHIRLSKVDIKREDLRAYFDLDGDYKINANEFALPHKKGQLIVTAKELESNVSKDEFTLFRLKSGIPVQGMDYKNEFLLNVSEDDLVSFTKGCFLGQEYISKVHLRSKPSWKLAARYEDECSQEEKKKMTSRVRDTDTSRMMGFVFVRNF